MEREQKEMCENGERIKWKGEKAEHEEKIMAEVEKGWKEEIIKGEYKNQRIMKKKKL